MNIYIYRAVTLLETLEMTSETQAMWKSLSTLALKNQKIMIAQRCFSALGDVARSRFLESLVDIEDNMEQDADVISKLNIPKMIN